VLRLKPRFQFFFHLLFRLILRIRCDAESAQCPLGKKFGCDPLNEAPQLIKVAKTLNLNVVGISFHVGSGCSDYPIYHKAIATARHLFDFAETLGYNFTLLDIGGGFPGDKGKTINEVAQIINKALNDYFPDEAVKVIAEPGRYYVASAFTLICNVHSKKIVVDPTNDNAEHFMYYINDGVYASFNCILYDHQLVVPKLLRRADGKKHNSTIWGPSCDALDQICENILLPELHIGDWMIFENMGAYTIPVASPFNGYPLPTIRCYISNEIW
jgi:ornithine decarboxylase